ncbi:MAG TPA: hypothetical protein DGT23_14625 [Micromonosporaceae bacterium]|nr:hypothetical protein [Micromonosporaceae bacterium]
MYSWIWRKLPFGVWGKLSGSLVMVGGIVALLWFIVFPWAEPILPFDDVQVGDPNGGYSEVYEPGASTSPTGDPADHEIPYETAEPSPTPSRKR